MKDLKSMLKHMILEELNEGRRERDWIAQQPEELQQAYSDGERQGLKIPHLAWIKKVRGEEPIEDIVPDVVEFLQKPVQQKLSDNGFEIQLSTKTYPSVNDLRILMKKIGFAEESDVQYDNVLKDPSQVQFVGKVGKWEVLMPVTRRGSIACDISGNDTTWCTQKRSGQNLFYSYVARAGQDIILFYVMDYTRTPDLQAGKDLDARLSIGFIDAKPVLKGQAGSISVDAYNEGLTEEYLQKALGENYSQIMSLMISKAEEVGGKHPAKEQMRKAATNLFYLKKLIKDYGEEEREDFLKQIIKQRKISIPVQGFLLKEAEKNIEFLFLILENEFSLHKETMRIIADSAVNSKFVSPQDPPLILNRKIFKKLSKIYRTPSDVLELIYAHADDDYLLNITQNIADNSNASPDLLFKIAKDMMPQKVVMSFGDPVEYWVIDKLLRNENTPSEALEHILLNDEAGAFTDAIQKHPNYKGNINESKVKISKSELRQIILEEVLKMMK